MEEINLAAATAHRPTDREFAEYYRMVIAILIRRSGAESAEVTVKDIEDMMDTSSGLADELDGAVRRFSIMSRRAQG